MKIHVEILGQWMHFWIELKRIILKLPNNLTSIWLCLFSVAVFMYISTTSCNNHSGKRLKWIFRICGHLYLLLGIKFDHRYQISVELGLPKTIYVIHSYLHLVRLFWNQVFTWASVILRFLANVALSVEAKYFCLWNLFSSSQICNLENEVRGFLRFGGVLFWYGWPIRLGVNGPVMHEESLIWDE